MDFVRLDRLEVETFDWLRFDVFHRHGHVIDVFVRFGDVCIAIEEVLVEHVLISLLDTGPIDNRWRLQNLLIHLNQVPRLVSLFPDFIVVLIIFVNFPPVVFSTSVPRTKS